MMEEVVEEMFGFDVLEGGKHGSILFVEDRMHDFSECTPSLPVGHEQDTVVSRYHARGHGHILSG